MAERAESETAMVDADTKCTAARTGYSSALTEFRTRLSRNLSETEADKRKRINSLSLTNIDRSLGIAPILGYEWNGSHAFFAGGKLCYNIAAGENSFVPVCISGGAFVGSDYKSTSNEDGEPSTDDVGFGYQNQSTLLKSIEDRVQQYGKIGFRVETPKLTLGSDFTGHLALNLDAYFGDKRTTTTTTNNSQLLFDGNPSGDPHVVSNDESSRRTVYSFVPTAGLAICYNTSGDDSVCLNLEGGANTNSGEGVFRTTLEYNF
jgi:hypothetical protein